MSANPSAPGSSSPGSPRPMPLMRHAKEGRNFWLGREMIKCSISGAETGGAYAFFGSMLAPGVAIPALVRPQTELGLFVLSGAIDFRVGGKPVRAGLGDFLSVGRGTALAYANAGTDPAMMLMIEAPAPAGASLLDLLSAAGTEFADIKAAPPPPAGAQTDAALLAALRRHGPAAGIVLAEDAAASGPVRSKLFRRGDGRRLAVVGDAYVIKARAEDTAGALSVVEAWVPAGGGPPTHIHRLEAEGFTVLSGTLTFYGGIGAQERAITAGPGTVVHCPIGSPHRFKNEGATPAKMLFWLAPGGMERLFDLVGEVLPDGSSQPPPPKEEQITSILWTAGQFGVEFPGM